MGKTRKSGEASTSVAEVEDHRHRTAKRKSNPPAMASAAPVPVVAKAQYAYNPHLPPVLRFDQTGQADKLETRLSAPAKARVAELLAFSASRALTAAEREELAVVPFAGYVGHPRESAPPPGWAGSTGSGRAGDSR
jgi:hypothetical protein